MAGCDADADLVTRVVATAPSPENQVGVDGEQPREPAPSSRAPDILDSNQRLVMTARAILQVGAQAEDGAPAPPRLGRTRRRALNR